MARGNALLALAAGIGTGLVDGRLDKKRDEERQEDRAMKREEYDLRMGQLRRAEGDQIALRNAAAPVTSGEVAFPTADDEGNAMPSAPAVYGAGNAGGSQLFTSKADADQAAAKQNDPAALASRVQATLNAQGKPVEAMEYAGKAQAFADKKWDTELRDAVGKGHDGIAAFLTRSQAGELKGKTIRAVPSEDGKSVTYSEVNPDGTMTPTKYTLANDQNGVITAAYQLAKIDPEVRYRHMVEEDKRAAANAHKEREITLRERELTDVKIPRMESQAALSEARGLLAQAQGTAALARAERTRSGGGSDDKVSREERLRWTTLHGEAGRRLGEATKSLRVLQTDPVFMAQAKKPGSPQAAQLQSLQGDVDQYKGDRDMYGGLLAGSQGAAAKAERDAKPAAAGGATPPAKSPAAAGTRDNPAKPADKASYDQLPQGAWYVHPTRGLQRKV